MSTGGPTKKPSMSLTMRVLFFRDRSVEPIIEPKINKFLIISPFFYKKISSKVNEVEGITDITSSS